MHDALTLGVECALAVMCPSLVTERLRPLIRHENGILNPSISLPAPARRIGSATQVGVRASLGPSSKIEVYQLLLAFSQAASLSDTTWWRLPGDTTQLSKVRRADGAYAQVEQRMPPG